MKESINEAHEKIKREFLKNRELPTEIKFASLSGKIEILHFISKENLEEDDELLNEVSKTKNAIQNFNF